VKKKIKYIMIFPKKKYLKKQLKNIKLYKKCKIN